MINLLEEKEKLFDPFIYHYYRYDFNRAHFLLNSPREAAKGEKGRNGNYESREREKGKRHCSSGTLIGLVRTIMGPPLRHLAELRAGKI